MNFNIETTLLNALLFACPLILIAVSGILNTRSGIANFAFDGIMCAGAATYCVIIAELKTTLGVGVIFLAFLGAILCGIIFSLVFSFATITCQANQIFTSMALNYIGYGLALVLPIVFLQNNLVSFAVIYITMYPWVAFLVTLFFVYLFAIFLFLTKYGLYLQATGENATVAALSYIHVRKLRYFVSMLSCSVCSFGGALLVYIFPNLFITNNNFSGLGFLVIALWMIGNNKFVWTTIVCILFSFVYQLSLDLQTFSSFVQTLPNWFLGMIPYLSALIFLMIFRFDTSIPQHFGQPYFKTGQIK